MIPIVVCTIGSKSFLVMDQSVRTYAPNNPLIVYRNKPSTYGEAYNSAMAEVFKNHEAIIIANDDVVLTPDTMPTLMREVQSLEGKVAFVATYSDNARQIQDVRHYKRELKPAERVSPYFSWVSREAFEAAQFPPLNWYSDDVMCEDLNALGFRHYVSSAYVHHAGSQTVGTDYKALNDQAMPWLVANRPQYLKKWFG